MRIVTLLAVCSAVVAGSATQLRTVYIPREVQQQDSHDIDPKYVIGEVIASEFDRHVPVLSDNLRGELNALRNDISRQFDSLKHHMDVKLDRMQRDAPLVDDTSRVEPKPRHEPPSTATPAATIRHNLAMAELRRLGADLTRTMNEEVAKLREEFRNSLNHLREQVQNSTDGLAAKLGDEFSNQAEESTTMLKKVFFLTRNQMTLIQDTLSNITSAIKVEDNPDSATLPPPSESIDEIIKGTSHNLPPLLSTLADTNDDFITTIMADTDPPITTTAGSTTTTAASTTTTTSTTTTASTTTEPEVMSKKIINSRIIWINKYIPSRWNP